MNQPPESMRKPWTPPPKAVKAGYDLFCELIPDLSRRADAMRVPLDMADEEVFQLYVGQIIDVMDALEASVPNEDEKCIRRVGHSLQGMSSTMGFPEISVVGEYLYRLGRAHRWKDCQPLIAQLRKWSATLR